MKQFNQFNQLNILNNAAILSSWPTNLWNNIVKVFNRLFRGATNTSSVSGEQASEAEDDISELNTHNTTDYSTLNYRIIARYPSKKFIHKEKMRLLCWNKLQNETISYIPNKFKVIIYI